jgi:hypothetical protein
MRTTALLLVGTIAAVAGFLGGRATAPAPRPTAPARASADARPAPVCVARLSELDLQRLRDEVAAAVKPAAPEPAAAKPAPATPPERGAATTDAHQVIDAAVARGRWTDDDAQQLRNVLAPLPPDEQFEVTRSLAVAVNSGSLRIETLGAPF